MRLRSITLGAGLGLAALLGVRPARADGADLQVSLGMNAGYVAELPELGSAEVKDGPRHIGAGHLPMRGGLWLLGPTFDTQITLSDRWMVPLFGGTIMAATGSFAPVVTSLDGSLASVRPSSAWRADFLLPGVGRRWKHRRWMFSLAARTGVSVITMSGDVIGGTTRTPLALASGTFLFQVEAEGCRRLDPERRLCFQVAPRLYDQSTLSGVTFGIRMEWGR